MIKIKIEKKRKWNGKENKREPPLCLTCSPWKPALQTTKRRRLRFETKFNIEGLFEVYLLVVKILLILRIQRFEFQWWSMDWNGSCGWEWGKCTPCRRSAKWRLPVNLGWWEKQNNYRKNGMDSSMAFVSYTLTIAYLISPITLLHCEKSIPIICIKWKVCNNPDPLGREIDIGSTKLLLALTMNA